MDLTYTVEDLEGGVKLMRLRGDLDMHTVAELEEAVQEVINNKPPAFIMELSGVKYISSQGIGVMMAGHAELLGQGSELILAGLSDSCRRPLELVGLLNATLEAKTEEDALQLYRNKRKMG